MIDIYDFFEIDTNDVPVKKPINRNAFTLADVKYKLKCIKAMQDLGMEVTIDKIGNICGTFSGKLCTDKSVIGGSHTDSVDNGGQFDGPLGVYTALKTAEDIVKSGKQNAVNYKAVIYACEESTLFEGKACLGSKYLRGDNLNFDTIISRDGLSLREHVKNFKNELFKQIQEAGLKPLIEVDKVIEPGEIVTAIEGHIEQADVLRESGKSIGICTSITAPYRLKADISDIKTASRFICALNESAKTPENLQKYRVTVPNFSIKDYFNEANLKDKKIITLRTIGARNHSGATPMDRREDAVLGTAKFIEFLSNNPNIQFLETSSADCGANQINDCCEVKLAISSENFEQTISQFLRAQEEAKKLANVKFEVIDDITKYDDKTGIFLDVRQQLGMSSKLTGDMIFETIKDIVHQTKCKVYMNITSKGEPFLTNEDLIKSASEICEENSISYEILKSWAGHDLATLTKDEFARTILLFCASIGGSHNPNETTTLDAIHDLVKLQSKLTRERII